MITKQNKLTGYADDTKLQNIANKNTELNSIPF